LKKEKMRISWYIFFIVCITTKGFSQFELSKKSISIAPIANKSALPSATSPITYPSIFNKKKEDSQFNISLLKKKEETPNNIMIKESFNNPADKVVAKMNKAEGEIQQGFRTDQFLGEFRSQAKSVRIVCRDHEAPDGDRVKILLNGLVVAWDIVLDSEFKELKFDLKKGFNKIDFEALNQGTSGPNTAEFQVYDELGALISSNKWNLTTGIKATIIVVKE
jgi:hypothetical protein